MPALTRQQRRAQERSVAKRARGKNVEAATASRPPRPFLLRTKTLLAIAASIATTGTAAYAFWPTLVIDGVPWDNSRSPLEAKFLFRNGGRIPIYDVHFRCTINTATVKELVTEANSVISPVTGQRRGEISPGVALQRDCGSSANAGAHPSKVRIDAQFTWPVIGHTASVSRYFVSNTDSSGRSWMSLEK